MGRHKRLEERLLKKPLADFARYRPEDFVKRFDKDDGKIDSEEAPALAWPKRFKELDNQDGKLDRDEVRAILQVIRDSPGSNPMGSGKLSLFPQRDPIDFDALDKNAERKAFSR